MKHTFRVAALALCALALSWSQAAADWDPGDCAKWVQLPDLTTAGMDIYSNIGGGFPGWQSMMRDDYLCTSPIAVTDFHVWGSWLGDANSGLAGAQVLLLRVDPGPTYTWVFQGTWGDQTGAPWGPGAMGPAPTPMTMTSRLYYTMPGSDTEIFYDAIAGSQIGTDTQVWQYNFYIDEHIAYVQEGTPQDPQIYYIYFQFKVANTAEKFGVKTRDPNDGQYGVTTALNPGYNPWLQLAYPVGHPYQGQPIDLAFVVTPEPATIVIMALGTGGLLLLKRKRVISK